MFERRWVKNGFMIFSLFFLFFYVLELDAFARIGGGRSFGSRGSRSYSTPSYPSRSATSPQQQVGPSPSQGMNRPQTGGFMRSLGGGILGGLLGGMLFRSLGFAGPGAGAGGGGIGLFDIALIGLILYGIWWFIKKRRQEAAATAGGSYYQATTDSSQGSSFGSLFGYSSAANQPQMSGDVNAGLQAIRQTDPSFDEQRFKDYCMDTFFTLQGAWAARDLSKIRNLFTDEAFQSLQADADELKRKKQINRLDNIAVRSVDILEVWQEFGKDFITVHFYANLVDYTVDELTGDIVAGSRTEPVKFEEFWTFTRPVGNSPWQLSAISQAS